MEPQEQGAATTTAPIDPPTIPIPAPSSGEESTGKPDPFAPGSEIAVREDGAVEQVSRVRAVVKHTAQRAGRSTAHGAVAAARTTGRVAVVKPAGPTWRYTWRFVRGEPLIGPARTNATFWREGDKDRSDQGKTGSWSYKPGYQRAATRLGATLAGTGAGTWVAPEITATVGMSAGSVMLAYGGYNVLRAWMTRQHRHDYVKPLHKALAPQVWTGADAAPSPEVWLHVPVGFKHIEGVEVRVDLPADFSGDNQRKRQIAQIASEKLAMSDATSRFHMEGDKPYMVLKAAERPPQKVKFADVVDQIMAAKEAAPLVGIGVKGRHITFDLEADSPHVLASAGSGGGKSVLLKIALMQQLYRGGICIILDKKRTSHQWAKGLPNVIYCRHIQEMHDILISLSEIIDQRYEYMDEHADEYGGVDNVPVGPRVSLVVEEVNATLNKLKTHWKKIKEKEDQALSPSVEAFNDLLFMGRQGLLNVYAVAQSATSNAMGGPEARENFATRCLARYTVNAWKMLVPEVWPAPKKSTVRGRWQVVASGEAEEAQVIFATDEEARSFAVSGTVTPVSEITQLGRGDRVQRTGTGATQPSSSPSDTQQEQADSNLGDDQEDGERTQEPTREPRMLYAVSEREDPQEPTQEPIGLSQAVSDGIVSVGLEALRSARKQDSEFPAAVGKKGQANLYNPDDLARWERNRVRSA